MPTYDYLCDGCQHQFEHFQSMTSRRLRKCPECGERKLERLIGSGAGVIFKGSGFYETDYKRSGESVPSEKQPSEKQPSEKQSSEKRASEKSSGSSSSSSETKSESRGNSTSDAKKSGGSGAKDA